MIIKNTSGSNGTWCGQLITAGSSHTIETSELSRWQSDSAVINAIATTSLTINNGVSDLSSANGIKLLLGNITEVTKLPEAQPFATPAYRTKINAIASIQTIEPGSGQEMSFLLTEERYVSGGALIVENAQIGDYITAEVCDTSGVIPEAYRAALCESWPTVARYIEKAYMKVYGQYSVYEINTFPLNAKISAGLYLKLTYFAANTGSNRKVAINYNLTKKL